MHQLDQSKNDQKTVSSTYVYVCLFVCLFGGALRNISVISWRAVVLVEGPGENHRHVASH
jgi:hypothetical protein